MKKFVAFIFSLVTLASVCGFAKSAVAHENYVLTQEEIHADLEAKGTNVFSSLKDWDNDKVALATALGSLAAMALYFWFQHSAVGVAFDGRLQKLEGVGHVILRIALAASLIVSAHFNSFLGPEITLHSIPLGEVIKYLLYVLGALMAVGLWSEVVGAVSLVVLLIATWVYKDYMLTYFNYFGEFIALLLFGSRVFSFDRLIYGAKEFTEKHHDAEIALVRITYGISIMHPAIVFKLIHPQVIVDIVNRYNLTQFHWLFPHDPLLVALGTGMAQVAVGICLIIGFQTRLNTLVTFGLMVLSVLFFKEAVWPHYILLALALYLMINNGGKFTLDNYIQTHKEKLKSFLLRKAVS